MNVNFIGKRQEGKSIYMTFRKRGCLSHRTQCYEKEVFCSVQKMKTLKMGFRFPPPHKYPPPPLLVKKVFRSSFPQYPTLHHPQSSEVGKLKVVSTIY